MDRGTWAQLLHLINCLHISRAAGVWSVCLKYELELEAAPGPVSKEDSLCAPSDRFRSEPKVNRGKYRLMGLQGILKGCLTQSSAAFI